MNEVIRVMKTKSTTGITQHCEIDLSANDWIRKLVLRLMSAM